jgi:hypothetical protein
VVAAVCCCHRGPLLVRTRPRCEASGPRPPHAAYAAGRAQQPRYRLPEFGPDGRGVKLIHGPQTVPRRHGRLGLAGWLASIPSAPGQALGAGPGRLPGCVANQLGDGEVSLPAKYDGDFIGSDFADTRP